MDLYSPYIPIDRRLALAAGENLSETTFGAALFADMSGFTPLTRTLVEELGRDYGAEELTRHLDIVYSLLIGEVHRFGGTVLAFNGDAITCWFDESRDTRQDTRLRERQNEAGRRAVAAALAMHKVISELPPIETPSGASFQLGVKISVAMGRARRYVVGDEKIELFDVMVGRTIDKMAAGEHLASSGEVLICDSTANVLGGALDIREWRVEAESGERFAVINHLDGDVIEAGWPDTSILELPEEASRPWILGPVYERLARGQGAFLAELRQTVSLFIRFTGIDYDIDREAGSKLDAYIRWVQHTAARYQGYLVSLTFGDKGSYLQLSFGAPIAHEQDQLRAAMVAQVLRDTPDEFKDISSVQIGITQGLSRVGTIGGAGRHAYGVHGDGVNMAARLMQAAEPGQILLGAEIASAIEGSFEIANLGRIPLKGRVDPLQVFALGGARTRRTALKRRQWSEATFFGREAELNHFNAALRDSQETRSTFSCLIEGEAGIGKTALMEAMAASSAGGQYRRLSGQGDPVEPSTPYLAWRTVYADLFGMDEGRGAVRSAQSQIGERLSAWGARIELAPLLNQILGTDFPENALTEQMADEVRATNMLDLMVNLLKYHSQTTNLLITLDDAHWLDAVSWSLVRLVHRDVPGVAMILTSRPFQEEIPDQYRQLLAAPGTIRLSLTELPLSAVEALLKERLDVRRFSPELLEFIHRKAEGHPFFSEELAFALRDNGIIEIVDGECRIAPDVPDFESLTFPNTIQGVITSRIDRLSPEQQLSLKVASVIGRIFAFRLLRDVYPVDYGEMPLRDNLATLERLDIMEQDAPPPDDTYTFRQLATRDVAYRSMLLAQRRQLHQDIGAWYETKYGENLSPFYPLLAYHWTEAGHDPKSLQYLDLAGEQALASSGYKDAAGFFLRALELSTRVEETDGREGAGRTAGDIDRAHRMWKLGEAYWGWGRFAECRTVLEQAAVLYGYPVPNSGIRLGANILNQIASQVVHRLAPGRFVGRAGEEERRQLLETARVYHMLAGLYYFNNDRLPTLLANIRMLNMAEKVGPSWELANAYATMCITTGIFGMHRFAEAYYNLANATARADGRPNTLAHVLRTTGLYFLSIGNWQRVRDDVGQSRVIHEQLGDKRNWGDSLALLGHTAMFIGDYHHSIEIYEPLADPKLDMPQQRGWATSWIGGNHLYLGQLDKAQEWLDEGLRVLAENADLPMETSTYGFLAMTLLRLGDEDGAVAAAEKAAAMIAATGGTPTAHYSIDGYLGTAETFLSLCRQGGNTAINYREKALQACKDMHSFARLFPIGRPAAGLYQGMADLLEGKSDRALKSWQTGLQAARQLGMPYPEARILLELGAHPAVERVERERNLQKALEIFTRLGTPYEIELAQTAIGAL